MSGNHIIVESGGVIYVVGPREGHTWHDHKGMWEVCKIDNAAMWDNPEDEAVDRENARKIRDGLNSYASSRAELNAALETIEVLRRSEAAVAARYIGAHAEIERLTENLRNQHTWVQHWQEDVAAGLKPSTGSLAKALENIEAALSGSKE